MVYNKEKYLQNREEKTRKALEYYYTHKEQRIAYQLAYHEANKEHYKQYTKEYWLSVTKPKLNKKPRMSKKYVPPPVYTLSVSFN